MSRKGISLLLATAMLISLLSGCGSGTASTASEEGATTITIATSCDINDMNPHKGNAAIYGQNLVYEGLVTYADGEIQPMLAETWKVSDDGLTYTFHIRDNAKFSDGAVCDANNIVKNFDAVFENYGSFSWMGVTKYTESYEAIDDLTFVITLSEPCSTTLQDLSAVRPFRMLADAGFGEDGSTVNGISEAIGTGPWMLTEYVENDHATFEKNPYYWGEEPELDGFTLRIITDSQTAVSALEAGEVDMIYDMYESQLMDIDTYNSLADAGYNSYISDPVLTRVLTLNSSVAPLDDFNVRKALILALDRETMVESVFGGLEELAQSYYWPGTMYCDVGLEGYEYDPEEAAALLDEAGWILEDGAEYRTKNGEELSLTFYYDASNTVQTSIAQICQSDFKKIGCRMEIIGEEASANINRIYSGEFQIGYTVSWGDPYDPQSTLAAMATEYGSAEYFALAPCEGFDEFAETVFAIERTVDEGERQEMYAEVMQYIEDQYSILPISYQTNRAITQENVTGVTFGYSNVMPLDEIVVE